MNVDALDRWLQRYSGAWETKDADAVVGIFSEDARYFQTPYDDPFNGREAIHDYWVGVTTDQKDIRVRTESLGVIGDKGIARWNATFTSIASGHRIELDGIFVLQFDASWLCRELREWWHAR